MRIKSVRIKNFRCLGDVRLELDDVTTLIGPNGAGKSSVLRALDWFFNSEPARLTEDDIYSGADPEDRVVEVEVTFDNLTARDRDALGDRYAPAGAETFTAWRTWSLDGGDKTSGKARAFPPFEEVRSHATAADKRAAYIALSDAQPDLTLPRWTKVDSALAAMTVWESENPDRLEDAVVGDTHFFGFNGRNVLSGLFDFVLVTADLRARDESVEGKKTVIGRILEQAVDKAAADAEFADLATDVTSKQAEITARHLGGQLDALAKAMTHEVSAFTSGRDVVLRAVSAEIRPAPATITVSINDALIETSVERQGHGFQRALLISALKLLADQGAAQSDGSVVLLAIEEPELFQHPTQARVFARVLRELAQAQSGGMQVAYATHSPFFIDARYFDQVRRVTRTSGGPSGHPRVSIRVATIDSVAARLAGTGVTDTAIRSRWDQICTRNLAEALFADAVVLVEGDNDKGILDGIAARTSQRQLEMDGVTVAVSHGKSHLYTPHAILAELGIQTLVVFDNDKGGGERLRQQGKDADASSADEKNRLENRRLLAYLGHPEEDFPEGQVALDLHVWADRLEDVLTVDWPEWDVTRGEIAASGRGAAGKNTATYELAARECQHEPRGALLEVVAAARALVAQ